MKTAKFHENKTLAKISEFTVNTSLETRCKPERAKLNVIECNIYSLKQASLKPKNIPVRPQTMT